jgi:hypothetical protein
MKGAGQHKAPPGKVPSGGANTTRAGDPRRYRRRIRSIIVQLPMP